MNAKITAVLMCAVSLCLCSCTEKASTEKTAELPEIKTEQSVPETTETVIPEKTGIDVFEGIEIQDYYNGSEKMCILRLCILIRRIIRT